MPLFQHTHFIPILESFEPRTICNFLLSKTSLIHNSGLVFFWKIMAADLCEIVLATAMQVLLNIILIRKTSIALTFNYTD